MVILELENLGKRFNRHWIFRHLNYIFEAEKFYAITGANGSGKSTLLQVIAGAVTLSEGKVKLVESSRQSAENTTEIVSEKHHQFLSIAAPYLEVIEEMTLIEFFEFHFRFKPLLPGFSIVQIIEMVQLQAAANRQIRQYSSGMKQRVKLAQAIFSNVPIVLLDEPLTNLDTKGEELYNYLIEAFCKNRLTIVCSNNEAEMHFCKERLDVEQYR